MYPMHMGRRVARIRKGIIPPEIKFEQVVTALLNGVKFEKQVVHANKTHLMNWRGFGLVLLLMIMEEDFRNLSQIIRGRNLNVVIEGKPPTCYKCHQTGRLQKQCPLRIESEERKRIMKFLHGLSEQEISEKEIEEESIIEPENRKVGTDESQKGTRKQLS